VFFSSLHRGGAYFITINFRTRKPQCANACGFFNGGGPTENGLSAGGQTEAVLGGRAGEVPSAGTDAKNRKPGIVPRRRRKIFCLPISIWNRRPTPKVAKLGHADSEPHLSKLRSATGVGVAARRQGPVLQCLDCDRPDPLKSGKASGWLQGELRRPE
jgi:hypothetical protein